MNRPHEASRRQPASRSPGDRNPSEHPPTSARPNRREWLRLVGRGAVGTALAGTGMAAWVERAAGRGPSGRATPRSRGAAAQDPIVRTLLGDLAPSQLPEGAILFHEHLSFTYPRDAESHVTDDVDLMIEEVGIAQDEGIALIVDGGHPDMDRDLSALRRIADATGMPVVASGGYYMQSWYPPEISTLSAEEIADRVVAEAARDGLGALGEIGQEEGELTADEEKVFEAIGMAQERSGLPVFTHNPYSVRATDVPRDAALRQLDILEAAGADPTSVAIGHVCCLDDPEVEVAIELARRGAYIGFDRVTLEFTMPDEDRVAMAMALVEAGFADHLLLSSDFYSGRTLKANGGPGLALTATVFAPMLLEAGLDAESLRGILEDNPRRFLSFTPREA